MSCDRSCNSSRYKEPYFAYFPKFQSSLTAILQEDCLEISSWKIYLLRNSEKLLLKEDKRGAWGLRGEVSGGLAHKAQAWNRRLHCLAGICYHALLLHMYSYAIQSYSVSVPSSVCSQLDWEVKLHLQVLFLLSGLQAGSSFYREALFFCLHGTAEAPDFPRGFNFRLYQNDALSRFIIHCYISVLY